MRTVTAPATATVEPRPHASAVTATAIIARRTLVDFMRTPQLIVVGTIQGAMFLLIFRYVLGGALDASTGGLSYIDFLVPGYVVTGVRFSGTAAAAGVAEDLQHGVVDRLRSLPIGRRDGARRVGRHDHHGDRLPRGVPTGGSLADFLIAFGLVIVYGFTFTWVFIVIGLFASSAQAAQGLLLLVFPFAFVSSAYVPADTMPGWMQPIGRNQPITYMVDSVRSWVIDDPGVTLVHGARYYTARGLLCSAALVVVFAPFAVSRYRSG